jgi:hypothetical protein
MIGFVYAIDLVDRDSAIDSNEGLGGGPEKGDIVLIVPFDAIEAVS